MSFDCKEAGIRMDCFWPCPGARCWIQRFGGRDAGPSFLLLRVATRCEPESRRADSARYRPSLLQRRLRYASVWLRMDFRAPNTVGAFVYHCQLLHYGDGGMMGRICVEPADAATSTGALGNS